MKPKHVLYLVIIYIFATIVSCDDTTKIENPKENPKDESYKDYYRIISKVKPEKGDYGVPSSPTWGFVKSTAPENFYTSLNGLKGEALKIELKKLASVDISKTSYDWQRVDASDEDPRNKDNVVLIYTGKSKLKNPNNGTPKYWYVWNREHVFACSNGGFKRGKSGAGSDNHHIRACDSKENSRRNNHILGKVGTGGYMPRAAVKGDVTRMTFYVSLVYNIEAGNNINLDSAFVWNKSDKVDDWEMRRNNVISRENMQGNRNPFIDRPELIDFIFGDKKNVTYNVK